MHRYLCTGDKSSLNQLSKSNATKGIRTLSGEINLAVTTYTCTISVFLLNTDDESSMDQLPKSKCRGKGQCGVQEATEATRTLSGETNIAVTTCTCTI